MAAPTTWTELKAELLADCMRADDEALIARLPYFIGRAEAHFQRELFSPEREVKTTLVVASGVAALPPDFGGVRTAWIDRPVYRVLEAVTPSALRRRYPTATYGTPLHFAIEGESMLLGPNWPNGRAIMMTYTTGIAPLGPQQASNWLLVDHPDVYVQASLVELYEFTEHYQKADRCRAQRDQAMASISRSARRRRTNSGPLAASLEVRQGRTRHHWRAF
jgi:hypothetical protein